jgi:site-specific DNA-methyltransferase (adenine-specific)
MQDPADNVTIDMAPDRNVRRIQLGMETTGKTDYVTPQSIFAPLDEQFAFSIDLAADRSNCRVPRYFGPGSAYGEDALKEAWHGRGWLNPPFGRNMPAWIRKAIHETTFGDAELVCMLMPVSYVGWFWDLVEPNSRSTIIDHRIKFEGTKHVANFDVRIALFSERRWWANVYPCIGRPATYGPRTRNVADEARGGVPQRAR